MSGDVIPYPALARSEKKRFVAAFNALALSKSTEVDAVKMNAYFLALSDSPIDGVEQAAIKLRNEPGAFLPDAGRWRSMADDIGLAQYHKDLGRAQPATRPITRETEAPLRAAQRTFLAALSRYVSPASLAALESRLATTAVPELYCAQCRDTGFLPAPDPRDLARVGYQAYRVRTCACKPTNPVLERQRVGRKRLG
jgi:hypothetical protein